LTSERSAYAKREILGEKKMKRKLVGGGLRKPRFE
jgi:hypothetical protein